MEVLLLLLDFPFPCRSVLLLVAPRAGGTMLLLLLLLLLLLRECLLMLLLPSSSAGSAAPATPAVVVLPQLGHEILDWVVAVLMFLLLLLLLLLLLVVEGAFPTSLRLLLWLLLLLLLLPSIHGLLQRLLVPLQAHVFLKAGVDVLLHLLGRDGGARVLLLQCQQALLQLVLEQVLLLGQGQVDVLERWRRE